MATQAWASPLDRRVSLQLPDLSLREALDRLAATSSVPLAYSSDLLPLEQRVCVRARNVPLGGVLAALLRRTNVAPTIVAGRVVLAPIAATNGDANIAIARAVSVLDRIVVTGNAVAASRRPLSVGVEVIDGEQLRRHSVSALSDVLGGAVPGLWLWSQSPSALLAQYGSIRGASSFGTSYPKVYLDGVEAANPLLVTQLNPDAVDRVEVIRGPQGSALYGSDAISGVINVVTRHSGVPASGTRLQLQSAAGAAASAFAPAVVPTHDQRLTLRLGSGVRSMGASAEFGQTGSVYPSSDSRHLSFVGDGRLVGSRATVTMTARYFDKRSGAGRNPLFPTVTPASGESGYAATSMLSDDEPQTMRQYTLGTSAVVATEGRWTHTMLAGVDGYNLAHVDTDGPFPSSVDSALRAARGSGDRATLRATSVAEIGRGSIPATITLGVEHSVLRQATGVTMVSAPAYGERYPTAWDEVVESWNHNTGFLSQVSGSWRNAIFVTGGMRVERNDAFSGSNRYPVLPMLGVTAVRSLGAAELKLRAAYGKGIRPPQTPARVAPRTEQMGFQGARVALDPEVQSGIEVGAELYVGRMLSMQATRFDQRATGLIQNVAISVDTQLRAGAPERRVQYQLQNVGAIDNRGWELQATFSPGPLALSGALTTVDSRVRALAAGYMGDLRPGDRMLAVPARVASLTASWTATRWTAALTATRARDWVNYDRLVLARAFLASEGPSRYLAGPYLRDYWRGYDGDTHLRLAASRELPHGVALIVTGDNLLGGQLGEPDNGTIRPGRTLTGGLRASF